VHSSSWLATAVLTQATAAMQSGERTQALVAATQLHSSGSAEGDATSRHSTRQPTVSLIAASWDAVRSAAQLQRLRPLAVDRSVQLVDCARMDVSTH
jgi:hypothetical protein